MKEKIKKVKTNVKKNGLSCPDCQNELVDSNPMLTILGNPSKKEVSCEKCGYNGFRVV
jgi:C4-type Zn-finger protein